MVARLEQIRAKPRGSDFSYRTASRIPIRFRSAAGDTCRMVAYRRIRLRGGMYFLTAALRDRRSRCLIEHVDLLRDSLRATRRAHPFEIVAMVVLPDHFHAIWALPEGDDDYPTRMRLLKTGFTRALARAARTKVAWQRRYWEHTTRDADDLRRHVDYIHLNPVKHGWVACVRDWPASTFHRYVADGRLRSDWAGA